MTSHPTIPVGSGGAACFQSSIFSVTRSRRWISHGQPPPRARKSDRRPRGQRRRSLASGPGAGSRARAPRPDRARPGSPARSPCARGADRAPAAPAASRPPGARTPGRRAPLEPPKSLRARLVAGDELGGDVAPRCKRHGRRLSSRLSARGPAPVQIRCCAGDYFPREAIGTVARARTQFYGAGAILTHWITGLLRDVTGVYDQAYIVCAAMAAVSVVLMSPVKRTAN